MWGVQNVKSELSPLWYKADKSLYSVTPQFARRLVTPFLFVFQLLSSEANELLPIYNATTSKQYSHTSPVADWSSPFTSRYSNRDPHPWTLVVHKLLGKNTCIIFLHLLIWWTCWMTRIIEIKIILNQLGHRFCRDLVSIVVFFSTLPLKIKI